MGNNMGFDRSEIERHAAVVSLRQHHGQGLAASFPTAGIHAVIPIRMGRRKGAFSKRQDRCAPSKMGSHLHKHLPRACRRHHPRPRLHQRAFP